jgi:hypothetical protein
MTLLLLQKTYQSASSESFQSLFRFINCLTLSKVLSHLRGCHNWITHYWDGNIKLKGVRLKLVTKLWMKRIKFSFFCF